MTRENAEQIPGASRIIARFGGIRPMASKMSIPVTTVQGWKKRNVIPLNRLHEIREAAEQNNIDISDLVSDFEYNETAALSAPEVKPVNRPYEHIGSQKQPPVNNDAPPRFLNAGDSQALNDTLEKRLAAMEKKAVTRSTFINIGLLIITFAAVGALLWPRPQSQQTADLQNLQSDIGALQNQMAGIKKEDTLLQNLKEQAVKAQASVEGALSEAKEVSDEMLNGTLEERIALLESHIDSKTGTALLSDLLARYQDMSETVQGQALLSGAVAELNAFLQTTPEKETDAALETAATKSETLNHAFGGIPASDVKAAALLLGMTQFRSSLGRDNQPFNDDLQLLTKLTGESDPALKESLQRLAPYAEQGVLTPQGLTTEFKTITGDVVVASLKGEDVSIKDKAKARLNEVFEVKKNGELVSGTPTQATLSKTEDLLNQGNLEAAITQMQTLQGPASIAAAPWIDKAQATLMAQKLKMTLSHAINAKASGSLTSGGGGFMPGTLIQNDETGINILKKN